MKRKIEDFVYKTFDLAIVGGGIYGACLAWEAASRGLSVALIEKDDFASATSANSLKVIHGGFRYLQHGDIRRMRESMGERKALMRIAPHLVHPLPVLVPVYGHGMKGREILSAGLIANDLLGFDRNSHTARDKQIPSGHLISAKRCQELLPGIDSRNLTGGAVFYDAQVYNSERLVLAFLQTAWSAGAVLANYAQASGFLLDGNRVTGVKVLDRIGNERFDIRARLVVNAAGPWVDVALGQLEGNAPVAMDGLVKAVNLVTRQVFSDHAVGLLGENGYQDSKTLVKKGGSLLFVAPWREYSLIGTSYRPFTGSPDELEISEEDIRNLLEAFNLAYPAAGLTFSDVVHAHAGLLPADQASTQRIGTVQLANHARIINHRKHGISGLVSVVGVKYTTARLVAQQVIDIAFHELGKAPVPSISAQHPLDGGEIENYAEYVQRWTIRPLSMSEAGLRSLLCNYGTNISKILNGKQTTTEGEKVDMTDLDGLRGQVCYAAREEMAQTLADVVFRRTELGSAGHPGSEILQFCTNVMAEEMLWSPQLAETELFQVEQAFPVHARYKDKMIARV